MGVCRLSVSSLGIEGVTLFLGIVQAGWRCSKRRCGGLGDLVTDSNVEHAHSVNWQDIMKKRKRKMVTEKEREKDSETY